MKTKHLPNLMKELGVSADVEIRNYSENSSVSGFVRKTKSGERMFYAIYINDSVSNENKAKYINRNSNKNMFLSIAEENNLSIQDVFDLETIVHELIHVSQMETGRLQYLKRGDKFLYSWEGSPFKAIQGNLPFEDEAEELAIIVLNNYFKKQGTLKKFINLLNF